MGNSSGAPGSQHTMGNSSGAPVSGVGSGGIPSQVSGDGTGSAGLDMANLARQGTGSAGLGGDQTGTSRKTAEHWPESMESQQAAIDELRKKHNITKAMENGINIAQILKDNGLSGTEDVAFVKLPSPGFSTSTIVPVPLD